MTISFLRRRALQAGLLGFAALVASPQARAQLEADPADLGPVCDQPFAAARTLPGRRVTVPGTNVSFSLPQGWTGRMEGGTDGLPVYRVTVPATSQDTGIILLHRREGDDDRAKTLDELLTEGQTVMAGFEPAIRTETRWFSVGQGCGGQALFRTARGEGNVAIIRRDGWLYALFARYPQRAAGAVTPGIDTILATVQLVPPAAAPVARVAPAFQ